MFLRNADVTDPYYPRHGFGSALWISQTVSEIPLIDHEKMKWIMDVLYQAHHTCAFADIQSAMDQLTDAMILWNLVSKEHPFLHEIAYQCEHAGRPDVSPEYSAKRMSVLRIVFCHPIAVKYLACTWYVGRDGSTVVGHLAGNYPREGKFYSLEEKNPAMFALMQEILGPVLVHHILGYVYRSDIMDIHRRVGKDKTKYPGELFQFFYTRPLDRTIWREIGFATRRAEKNYKK